MRMSMSLNSRENRKTGLKAKYDGAIAEKNAPVLVDYKVPVARNWALARCRFCGICNKSALRSATA